MHNFKNEFRSAFRNEAGSRLLRATDKRLHGQIIDKAKNQEDSGNATVMKTLTGV